MKRIYENTANQRSINEYYDLPKVYTCKGNAVEVYVDTNIVQGLVFEVAAELHEKHNLVDLGDPTYRYNCHSYAWYWKSTENNYNMPEPGAFLEDRTYIQSDGGINDPVYGAVGDIVVYFSDSEGPIHSGVISAVTGTSLSQIEVVSKWAHFGLYRHLADDCTYIQETEVFQCNRIVVYRLCEHFDSNHSCFYNATTHTCSCSICGPLGSNEHNYLYTSLGSSSHRKDCDECDYFTTASHSFAYQSTNSSRHTIVCEDCGYSELMSHSFVYQSENASQHTMVCEDCGYSTTASHSLKYQSVNLAQHSITCEYCDYLGRELHKLNALSRCSLCGAKGHQIEINSFEEEKYIQ